MLKPLPLHSSQACRVLSQGLKPYFYAIRPYQSSNKSPEPPFPPANSAILAAAIRHVPEHGFSSAAVTLGAREAGYLDISKNLLPSGVFDLILYHLVTQRLALKDTVQFPERTDSGAITKLGVGAKVRALTLARLRANEGLIHRWPEALAIMAQPSHVLASLRELARLADEIWFLAGDTSVDTSWYTKRASLSTIYAAAELFMTQDRSAGFADTERFLDARLRDASVAGKAVRNVVEWTGFTGQAFVNVLRSKGVRI